MGSPLADDPKKENRGVDTGAILFFIPFILAELHLINRKLAKDMAAAYRNERNITTEPVAQIRARQAHRANAYLTGREFFTWERSLLCPICLHWWLTVLFVWISLVADWNFVTLYPGQIALAYLVNHLIIRKIS